MTDMRRYELQIPVDANLEKIQMAYKDTTALYAANASGIIEYIGRAAAGTNSSTALWQIKKLQYDVAFVLSSVLFAQGSNQYDKDWTARASYTYL